MNCQAYLNLLKKHQEEVSNFPIAYAFNEKQLEDALDYLGATKDECVSVFGHGDIVKKKDAPRFVKMLKNHRQELKDALKDEAFAEGAFLYEMDNHEYAINWDGDEEVLRCFGLDYDELVEMGLENAYRRARNKHMENARKWDMI